MNYKNIDHAGYVVLRGNMRCFKVLRRWKFVIENECRHEKILSLFSSWLEFLFPVWRNQKVRGKPVQLLFFLDSLLTLSSFHLFESHCVFLKNLDFWKSNLESLVDCFLHQLSLLLSFKTRTQAPSIDLETIRSEPSACFKLG